MSRSKINLLISIIFLVLTVAFFINKLNRNDFQGFSTVPTSVPTLQVESSSSAAVLGQRVKIDGCVAGGGLSDPECTPGAIFPEVTKDQICTSGYSGSVRNVSESIKNEVYLEYGIATHKTGEYEVDHLISLELGGSNDISNLWPEAAEPRPGFHEKDKVENYLHDQVCTGAITLQQAQQTVTTKWLVIYQQIFE